MNRTKLPRIIAPASPLCDYFSGNPGSLDFIAMNNHLPNKLTQSSAYNELSYLTETLESLQAENEALIKRLSADPSDFCGSFSTFSDDDSNHQSEFSPGAFQLEQKISGLIQRLEQRDKELVDIMKWVTPNSIKRKPNFIEVEVQKNKRPAFDIVSTSLLVSNDQRKFFKSIEIEHQNKELREMIKCQEEELRLLRARQNLFNSMQLSQSATLKIDQLSKGQQPQRLVDVAPDRISEQDITIQILQRELKSLIKQRRLLTDQRKNRKMFVRNQRIGFRSAVKIQKIMRGFLVRISMKNQKLAATKIQKVFRGWISRHKQTFLLEDENQILSEENNNSLSDEETAKTIHMTPRSEKEIIEEEKNKNNEKQDKEFENGESNQKANHSSVHVHIPSLEIP